MPIREPVFDPPFNVVRASHVELGVRDLARSRAFYVDCLGLLVSDEAPDVLYLRTDSADATTEVQVASGASEVFSGPPVHFPGTRASRYLAGDVLYFAKGTGPVTVTTWL